MNRHEQKVRAEISACPVFGHHHPNRVRCPDGFVREQPVSAVGSDSCAALRMKTGLRIIFR
jgi:hypothetical protein